MTRYNDDGYYHTNEVAVTNEEAVDLTDRQKAIASKQELDLMAEMEEDDTVNAPESNPKTITPEIHVITSVDSQVLLGALTESPMNTIDHTELDFTTEEVVEASPEALRSPVVNVTDIAKQVATSNDVEVSMNTQVNLDELIAEHLRGLSSDEARAWTYKQEQLGKAAGLVAMKREGKTIHTLKQHVANLLIKGVASGKTNQEILLPIAGKYMKAETSKVILDKKRPVQMEAALKELSKTDTKLQYLIKHTYMTVHTFGEWSDKSTIKAVMNKLRKAYVTADWMQRQDAINTGLLARVSELENLVLSQTKRVSTLEEAQQRARELSAEGKSTRTIAKVITDAGHDVSFKTISRWVKH